jgi:hypothetical protein
VWPASGHLSTPLRDEITSRHVRHKASELVLVVGDLYEPRPDLTVPTCARGRGTRTVNSHVRPTTASRLAGNTQAPHQGRTMTRRLRPGVVCVAMVFTVAMIAGCGSDAPLAPDVDIEQQPAAASSTVAVTGRNTDNASSPASRTEVARRAAATNRDGSNTEDTAANGAGETEAAASGLEIAGGRDTAPVGAYAAALHALGGEVACAVRHISDIVPVGDGVVHTFWRNECGPVTCVGKIESYPGDNSGRRALENGWCSSGVRSIGFSGNL